jgi:NADP-dependent 3-hydroxy acid dehydrogenase YdfG
MCPGHETNHERPYEELGPIEAVLLNATGGAGRPLEDASVERLRSIFDVRVAGALACVQAALPDLKETEGTVVFSGTTFADGTVTDQIEWGAVAPAARGLSNSLAASLDSVQVTYVRIGTGVAPTDANASRRLDADELAELYRDLVERDRAISRECDVYLRE